jgi:hypothetical protein
VPKPPFQILVLNPGSNLKQLRTVRRSSGHRGNRDKFVLAGRVLTRLPKPRRDSRRRATATAHQSRRSKDLVDFSKILFAL